MSIKTKTYRNCDMCTREIKGEFFFKCQNVYADYTGIECQKDQPSASPIELDVCLNCWDQMQYKEKA